MPRQKKAQAKAEYRNLERMEGAEHLFSFEVKTKGGWKKFTSLAAGNEDNAKTFAQRTAETWKDKNA